MEATVRKDKEILREIYGFDYDQLAHIVENGNPSVLRVLNQYQGHCAEINE